MTIRFHISDDLLLKYSAGTLDEASGLLVATHLALCPHCRIRNGWADALGGFLLESLEATPVSASMMDAVLARVLNEAPSLESAASTPAATNPVIPIRSAAISVATSTACNGK
jgi:putative transcriptional regulator